ncbi:cytochrome c3 family protein [Stakelama saccharophila]|uniref:Cytochrome c3 family protein n=1 Tax=Stakelama saccharophila TaxID=3075605 RepID=A0ABZ0B5Y1_9SPHN|nr:cytochrome c3 family protein [Stakelama sp. W311]WNO52714.1 cytochrome c3 family protein [Stakelama sp. W311]
MSQLFKPAANSWARWSLAAILLVPLSLAIIAGAVTRSGYVTGEGRFVDQIVPFSHKHHAGDLGIDCRYCHTGVETQASAVVPPTHTCMTCHSQLYTDADMLAPVRRSLAEGKPLEWKRVNRLPDYAYFDHHVHVKNGVPCAACHGDVRRMPLLRQTAPLTMDWCVSCHRDPEDKIVAPERVFDSAPYENRTPADRAFARSRMIEIAHHGRNLTECSICHR